MLRMLAGKLLPTDNTRAGDDVKRHEGAGGFEPSPIMLESDAATQYQAFEIELQHICVAALWSTSTFLHGPSCQSGISLLLWQQCCVTSYDRL